MSNQTERSILFEEDFCGLPVDVIAGDYSPAGEYHVVPAMSDTGRWRETVLHHSYKRISLGNWQVVEENDGSRALEQTIQTDRWDPMLAAGEPVWRYVTVETSIRPLAAAGWRAVIFRYRHSRRFYAATFEGGVAKIIRRDNDEDTVLAECGCSIESDSYTPLKIVCDGSRVQLFIDDNLICECEDADSERPSYDSGCIAFAANHVTRFGPIIVSAREDVAGELATETAVREHTLSSHREHYPSPKLWKKIKTGASGSDRNLRVGDINGDGKNEIVMARRTNRLGGDNHCVISSLAAWNLDGELLWSTGTPDRCEKHTTADLCFQVHDLDGDGKAEVYYCRDWEFLVADGATGEIMRRMPLPLHPSSDPEQTHRIHGDSIFFCDLSGTGRPDSIIIKDRYRQAWAYDKELNLLWTFAGNLGHFPYSADINEDGRDEVAFGYHLLDADGVCRWSVDYREHADNIAFVDLPDGSGGTVTRIVMAASDAGFFIHSLEGEELFHYPIGHAQSMCIGNLLPERDGIEIMCNTYWGPCGITATMNEAGELLHEFEPMPYACLLQPVNWVPASQSTTPADLVLLSTHTEQGGLIDGRGERLVMFPDDGHPVLCSDARDLDGDGVDEVLTWNEEEIWIYKADVQGRKPENYPNRNPWYNDSNYRAQLSLP